jgi:hypothetical protein
MIITINIIASEKSGFIPNSNGGKTACKINPIATNNEA